MKLLRLRHGRVIEVDKQVVNWRKHRFKMRKLCKQIYTKVSQHVGSDSVEAWYDTPIECLGNQTPAAIIAQKEIMPLRRLLAHCNKTWGWLRRPDRLKPVDISRLGVRQSNNAYSEDENDV